MMQSIHILIFSIGYYLGKGGGQLLDIVVMVFRGEIGIVIGYCSVGVYGE